MADDEIKFPLHVAPTFTLGNGGRSIVNNEEELIKAVKRALLLSPVYECRITKNPWRRHR